MQRLSFLILWLFVFTVPWQNSLLLGSIGTISQALGVVVFVVAAFGAIAKGSIQRPSGTLLLVAMFAADALLSTSWSADPDASLVRATTLLQLAAMSWLIVELIDEHWQLQGLLSAYVAGCCVNAIATFAHFVSGSANQDLRYAAAGFNPNDEALTLALAIPMACFLLFRVRAVWARLLVLLYVVAAPLAIVLSGSRTGVLACCTAFLVLCVGVHRVRWSRGLLLVAALGACVWCLVTVVPETTWTRISTIAQQIDSGDLNRRTAIWNAGLREFTKHPLLGVGEGAYIQISGRYLGEAFVAHNTFISILVELGLVGFLIFTSILANTAQALWRLEKQARGMWAAVGATWMVGVMAATWETQKPTWLMIAMIWAASRLRASEVDWEFVEIEPHADYEFSN